MEAVLNDEMKETIRLAMTDGDLDYIQTVEEAIRMRCAQTGEAFEVEDEEEFYAFFHTCVDFLFNATLGKMVLDGTIEMAVGEDGEFWFSLTDEGKAAAEKII